MKRTSTVAAMLPALLALGCVTNRAADRSTDRGTDGASDQAAPVPMKVRAPELRGVTEWINTKPLTLSGLRGRVVLLHFWTYG